MPHSAGPAEFFRPADKHSFAPPPASGQRALTRRLVEAVFAIALAAGFALLPAAPAVAAGSESASMVAIHGAGAPPHRASAPSTSGKYVFGDLVPNSRKL